MECDESSMPEAVFARQVYTVITKFHTVAELKGNDERVAFNIISHSRPVKGFQFLLGTPASKETLKEIKSPVTT